MFELTHLNIATIILDVSSITLVIGILLQTRFMRQSGRRSDRLFFGMLLMTIVMALSDIAGYVTTAKADPFFVWTQTVSMTLFYLAFSVLVMLWFMYCKIRFKEGDNTEESGFRLSYIPGIIVIILIVINLMGGFIFRIDMDGAYHRGALFFPMYAVYLVYLIAGFVYIGKYRTSDKKVLIPMWLYIAPIAISAFITFGIGEVSMAALGTAISIVFTHLGTMNEIAQISKREDVD